MSENKAHWLDGPGQKGFRINESERQQLIDAFTALNEGKLPDNTRDGIMMLLHAAQTGGPVEQNYEALTNETIENLENRLAEAHQLLFTARSENETLKKAVGELQYKVNFLENNKPAPTPPAAPTLQPNEAIISFTPEQKKEAAKAAVTLTDLGHNFSTTDIKRLQPAEVLHAATHFFNQYIDKVKTDLQTFKNLIHE